MSDMAMGMKTSRPDMPQTPGEHIDEIRNRLDNHRMELDKVEGRRIELISMIQAYDAAIENYNRDQAPSVPSPYPR